MENKNCIFGGIQLISTAGIEEALLKVAVYPVVQKHCF